MLVTKNLTPGDSVYGEKRIAVEAPAEGDAPAAKTEYRVWNPFRLVPCLVLYRGLFFDGSVAVLSLLLVFSVVWIRSSLSLAQRFCTWVLVWLSSYP